MRAWKYLVLVGGIAGVAGFFLPFVTFRSSDGQLSGAISAYQIVRGIDDVAQLIEGTQAKQLAAAHPEAQTFVTVFNEELAAYRGALVAFFAPAVALALLGALAGARRRMGRVAGLLALLLGAANAAVWLLFHRVSTEDASSTAAMGVGLHLLLVAGALGAVAGLGALVAPDRGDAG